jgi:hypothetical protein
VSDAIAGISDGHVLLIVLYSTGSSFDRKNEALGRLEQLEDGQNLTVG